MRKFWKQNIMILPALVLAFWQDGFVTLTLLAVLGVVRPVLLVIKRQHLI